MDNNIRTLFHHYAEDFDSIYGGKRNPIQKFIDLFFRESIRIRFTKTLSVCQPIQSKWILDVGCGSGRYAVLFAASGAESVTGIDLAPRMIELAKHHALQRGVSERCHFLEMDIMQFHEMRKYDYTIAMGVMDYILEPQPFIEHLLNLTSTKICLSFPNDIGLLAWQRKMRYRYFRKCELNLYSEDKIRALLDPLVPRSYTIETIARDYFVMINL